MAKYFLSSLSHLRLARSKDGYHFDIEKQPAIFPTEIYEEYGIEDPRMTNIGGTIFINYTAVSRYGVSVALASTTDFVHYTKHGVILPPENKNVVIFPEMIEGRYVMIHRPATTGLGNQQMWMGFSTDMVHWGEHAPFMSKRPGMWDSIRIGAGAVPIKTDQGWLEIYHGVNEQQGYCLGAVLMDAARPGEDHCALQHPLSHSRDGIRAYRFLRQRRLYLRRRGHRSGEHLNRQNLLWRGRSVHLPRGYLSGRHPR